MTRGALGRSTLPLALLAALLAVGVGACGVAEVTQPAIVPNPSELPASKTSHVVVIAMENKEDSDVIGSAKAPYMNELADRYGLATQSYGIRHPSLPNYIALTSGSTRGIDSNCLRCHIPGRSIVDQLEEAGISWRGYFEDQPGKCYRGGYVNGYAKKHNPFIYYDNVAGDPKRCAKIDNLDRLSTDLKDGKLPTYAWLTPNLCHDTHDCGVGTGDSFLARTVPSLIRVLGPHGFLVITYDEGISDAGCCGGVAAGGLIPTIVAGPDVRRGGRMSRAINHYGVLASIERALGLSPLRAAADPQNGRLTPLFTSPPRIR